MVKNTLKKLIKNNTPRWLVLIIDLYIVINTFVLAYLIRFNFEISFDMSLVILQIPFVFIAAFISFILTGSYKGTIRHTSFRDSLSVSLSSFIMFSILLSFVILSRAYHILPDFAIPISILVIHLLLNILFLIGSRHMFKELYNLLTSGFSHKKRVLIYGAGEAGVLTYSVLKEDRENNVFVVGFVDDEEKKSKKRLQGLTVYYAKKITKEFIAEKNIDEVIISIQKINTIRLLEIVDELSKFQVIVKIVPPAKTWVAGNLEVKQIKKVKIEDLLGREPIAFNNPVLKKEFNNKVVLITGAAGSIGSEICRQITYLNYKHLILVDQAESDLYNLQQYFVNKNIVRISIIVADVRNSYRMETIFKRYNPDIVFHAAAYKHVPLMEENPFEAVCVNIKGTKNIADLALKYQVDKFVLVSTDKAVNPTNVMGATKRIAEMYINSLNKRGVTKFITTRFGNVLGSNGSVIPLFQSQIEQGGPLTVTHKEITRYFMTIPEACQLVLEAGSMGEGGEIFVFDMGKSIKIFDLALNMIHLSGFNYPEEIAIKITGLRPGEKIYEELLASGENTIATYHEKIMIAKVKQLDFVSVKKHIEELCVVNDVLNFESTVKKMKEIVPEFISNNSIYNVLDVKKDQAKNV